MLTRLDGVHVTGGDLTYEPAMRRSRGHQTEEQFDYGGAQLHMVTGAGYLIAVPGERQFTAVTLDDDIFYLREDLVFAFEASLRWENGNVPGLRGKLPVVQFRGDGAVALRTAQPLVRIKLPAPASCSSRPTRLAGWIGRVIPRAVVPPSRRTDGRRVRRVHRRGRGARRSRRPRPRGGPPSVRPSRTSTPPPPPQPRAAPPPEPAIEVAELRGVRDASMAERRRQARRDLDAGSPLEAAARLAGRRGRVLLDSARDDDGLGALVVRRRRADARR